MEVQGVKMIELKKEKKGYVIVCLKWEMSETSLRSVP